MLSSPNYLHRICHGMMKVSGLSHPEYVEMWQTGKNTYELRVKISTVQKAFTEIHYVNVTGKEGMYIRGSFVCIPISDTDMYEVHKMLEHLRIETNFSFKPRYQNNKGRYEVDKNYARWCNSRGHQPRNMVLKLPYN